MLMVLSWTLAASRAIVLALMVRCPPNPQDSRVHGSAKRSVLLAVVALVLAALAVASRLDGVRLAFVSASMWVGLMAQKVRNG